LKRENNKATLVHQLHASYQGLRHSARIWSGLILKATASEDTPCSLKQGTVGKLFLPWSRRNIATHSKRGDRSRLVVLGCV